MTSQFILDTYVLSSNWESQNVCKNCLNVYLILSDVALILPLKHKMGQASNESQDG